MQGRRPPGVLQCARRSRRHAGCARPGWLARSGAGTQQQLHHRQNERRGERSRWTIPWPRGVRRAKPCAEAWCGVRRSQTSMRSPLQHVVADHLDASLQTPEGCAEQSQRRSAQPHAVHPWSVRSHPTRSSRTQLPTCTTAPAAPALSGGPERLDSVNPVAQGTPLDPQFIVGLQVHPELFGGAEVPRQPNRRVCGDPPLAVHDLVDSARRHTDRNGQLVLRDPEALDEVLQPVPGGTRRSSTSFAAWISSSFRRVVRCTVRSTRLTYCSCQMRSVPLLPNDLITRTTYNAGRQ